MGTTCSLLGCCRRKGDNEAVLIELRTKLAEIEKQNSELKAAAKVVKTDSSKAEGGQEDRTREEAGFCRAVDRSIE